MLEKYFVAWNSTSYSESHSLILECNTFGLTGGFKWVFVTITFIYLPLCLPARGTHNWIRLLKHTVLQIQWQT